MSAKPEYVGVPELAREGIAGNEKIRQWCREGRIAGALNIGTPKKAEWRVPRTGWEAFKRSLEVRTATEPERVATYRPRYVGRVASVQQ
jgi:hypothetical protein